MQMSFSRMVTYKLLWPMLSPLSTLLYYPTPTYHSQRWVSDSCWNTYSQHIIVLSDCLMCIFNRKDLIQTFFPSETLMWMKCVSR